MKRIGYIFLCILLSMFIAVSVHATEESSINTAAAQCNHNWMEGSVEEATCTKPGVLTSVCTLCNEVKDTTLPALDHSYDSMKKENALTHKVVCTVCGKEESRTHTWNAGTVTLEPTCKNPGEKTFTCPCGEIKKETVASEGHNFGVWAKTEKSHSRSCANCTEKETGNHEWKVEVIREATCKEGGNTKKTCTVCGYSLNELTDKLKDHTYENDCDSDCDVCGKKRTVSHKYGSSWSRDASGHWHECTKCGEKVDFKKHYPGPEATEKEDQVCITCDYVLQERLEHTHKFDKQWSNDESGHWHGCEGCDREEDFAAHSYDDGCDERCNICDYENEDAHTFGKEWMCNEKSHWKECELCGEKKELDTHIPGPEATETAPQLCSVCDFILAPVAEHSHDFSAAWQKTAENHWKECKCGEQSVPFPHSWDSGRKGSGNSTIYSCMDCGYERMEVSEAGFPWWIPVLLIVLVLAAGAAAYVFLVLPSQQIGKQQQPPDDNSGGCFLFYIDGNHRPLIFVHGTG